MYEARVLEQISICMNKQKILGDRGTSPSAVSDRPTALDNTDS
jgi:hypothetical protein